MKPKLISRGPRGGVRVFSMRYLQKKFAASRRKVIPNQWIKTLCGAVRRPTKKCTFFLPSRTDFLHFKSDLDVQNDICSLQKGAYISKNFRLRRANPVPKTTEDKRPVAVGFLSFAWTPVPTVLLSTRLRTRRSRCIIIQVASPL